METGGPGEKQKKYRREKGIPIFLLEFSEKTKVILREKKKKNPLRFYYDLALTVIQKNILTKAIPPGQGLLYISILEGISYYPCAFLLPTPKH